MFVLECESKSYLTNAIIASSNCLHDDLAISLTCVCNLVAVSLSESVFTSSMALEITSQTERPREGSASAFVSCVSGLCVMAVHRRTPPSCSCAEIPPLASAVPPDT